ncbi:filament-like plant protein 4 [Nymphaea colorata]|nr:filament-like plant protein 4 [Nymphaea colorata]XP_031475685.1 filament-like plant protein 4 [Nymphaea colorata]XP_031475687.1 filament-like plant protein 4 [Nymphaea colorata]XP_049931881.1 filament-like plant protein 4 [Nymphaea colorata]
MDRRSWPWRKKSSDKVAAGTDSNAASLANTNGQHEDLDSSKNINYVQISLEAYAKLTESEEQVKILNEKLSSTLSDVTTKDNLVKQHAKVAEEAVSGWEKAEAEALALKQQLETLTLQKHESDDRASHLDGALKECMRQIRHIKEESEQKMQELVISKSKQWEKVKFEFEAKITQLEEELLRSSAENDALARSLQERAAVIMDLKEEKSQADREIEVLKSNIQSCEREISSMKYELHVVSKELEIRNEEKNMSIRSAEVANRQHLESVKKIAKLEAECQRLRGLVRKKLPGPAALAQMKLEVENLGRDYGENRLRRSQVRNSVSHPPPVSEFLPDIAQQNQKETEFLTARLLAMEEETKMLKEALAKRNSELQASRNMCAKTASKLHAVEAQLQSLGHGRSLPKSNMEVPVDGSVDHNSSTPPSMTSMSEDGIDDEVSCAESWATALISELSNFKKDKVIDKGSKVDISTNLEVMDDFLEMEKLACMSTESNGSICMPNNSSHKKTDENGSELFVSAPKNETCIISSGNLASLSEEASNLELISDSSKASLPQLKKRLAVIFESHTKEGDVESILEDIRCVVQDIQNALPRASVCSSGEQLSETASNQQPHAVSRPMDCGDSAVPYLGLDQSTGIDLTDAISKVQNFVSSLAKEAENMCKDQNSADELSLSKMKLFSESVNKVLCGKMSIQEFILDLAHVLSEASELYFNVLKSSAPTEEANGAICADNPNGLENQVPIHSSKDVSCNGTNFHSNSDFEGLQNGLLCPASDMTETYNSLNEEIAQLKLEKDNVEAELASYKESLEKTKAQLAEMEKQLSEFKLQLAASEKSNSLAETQLKCMAESYKLLEVRVSETETELNQVKAKAEKLDLELQAEQHSHQEALAKCKDLQEQLQRNEECSRCSSSSAADSELKAKQEKEIAAAAEKLAQCQETIFLLGRQLKALRPAETPGSPIVDKRLENGLFFEDENEAHELHGMTDTPESRAANMELQASFVPNGDFSADTYNAALSSSDTEASPVTSSPISSKRQKHRSSKSSTSSASSFSTPEKQGRGISRFFSRGKTSL